MFVSLLASIALAVAMVSVPTPAQAQTPGVGSRGISFIPGEGGYPYLSDSQYSKNGRVAPNILTVKIGDVVYSGYCIEPSIGNLPRNFEGSIADWGKYVSDGGNKLAGDSARQAKLSWIAFNGYPYKSLEALSAIVGENLNAGEAVAATQAAVQYYSDGINPDFQRAKGSSQNRRNMKALYDHLTGPANVGIANENLDGVGGRAFVPDSKGHQDVLLFPRADESAPPADDSATPTTNQVPPTQPTAPTTSTRPSDSTETTSTTEESTSPATQDPEEPEEGVRIRTQASFGEDDAVQRISGEAPSKNIYDFVEIDNLPPGYYHLKTISFEAFPSGTTERRGDENYEFTITPDGRSIPRDVFTITGSNPDGTFNGYIYTYEDNAKEVDEGEAAAQVDIYTSVNP